MSSAPTSTALPSAQSADKHSNGKHVIIAARVININAIDFNSAQDKTRQDSGSSSSSQLYPGTSLARASMRRSSLMPPLSG